MKFLKRLKTRRYSLVLMFVALPLLAGGLFLSSRASKNRGQERALTRSETKKILGNQLRDGVGKEVKWDHSTENKIGESVNSVADFIAYRSGLVLSDRVKNHLIKLQDDKVKNKRRLLSADELADVLTEVSLRRLSKATDEEIQHAANVLNREGDGVILRANGRGHASYSTFIEQARAMRDLSRADHATFRSTVRTLMAEEIRERVQNYSEALPQKFGGADKQGVTPLQAFLITYSIVADDPLTFSKETLRGHLERTAGALKAKGHSVPERNKAFGNQGFIFSAPLDLLLDETTTENLLDTISERSQP